MHRYDGEAETYWKYSQESLKHDCDDSKNSVSTHKYSMARKGGVK